MKLFSQDTQKVQLQDLSVLSALELDTSTLEWIHSVKFSSILRGTDQRLLQNLATHWGAALSEDFDAVAAVPSHPLRSLLQVDLSFEWARCVARFTQRPLLKPAIRPASYLRSLIRGPQKNLTRNERRKHYNDPKRRPRYVVHISKLRRVLLVDDVMNTGCSLLEAREALHRAGHQVVGAFVLARTHS